MDGDKRFFIGGGNHHPRSSWSLLEGVSMQMGIGRDRSCAACGGTAGFSHAAASSPALRRHRIVDEHGDIEVSARKRLCDVCSVHSNVVAICDICGNVGFDLYNATVSPQEKVVCRGSL
jgi:hypothetical protein